MPAVRLETGLALAALALHAMLIAYLASLFIALARPIQPGSIILYPLQLAMIAIFLFGLPGFGLAGIAYMMSRREALKIVSIILIAQGIMLPAGMFYTSPLLGGILEEYRTPVMATIIQAFMFAGFAPIGLGVHLARLKPVRRRTAF